ncbi:uncharacterized protein LOC111338981 isoform X4 [Stylophora pistillata]|uniref:uncharacterized protein LOC111338981 isoform X4 n=1 Tax=Stylophora pistillata TaxID=50429 RepID=UPI000C03926B|nr:uncharacterized protein LOC111338981 isoform X4 [Stylophora pistillata]
MILFQWVFRIVVVAFWPSKENMKTTASSTPTETSIQACTSGSLNLQCGGFTNVSTIKDVRWRVKFQDNSGEKIYWLMSDDEHSKVLRLPGGMKVEGVSRQNISIERYEENSTINHVNILCLVDRHTRAGIKKTTGVQTVEGGNLNLTRILQKMVLCERVSAVCWSINGSSFVHYANCFKKELDGSNDELSLDFRRRLRFTRAGLILTNIQGYDDGPEIVVRFDIEKDSGGKKRESKTIRILVETAWHFSSSVTSVSRSTPSTSTPSIIDNLEPKEHKPTNSASAKNRLEMTLTVIGLLISFVFT